MIRFKLTKEIFDKLVRNKIIDPEFCYDWLGRVFNITCIIGYDRDEVSCEEDTDGEGGVGFYAPAYLLNMSIDDIREDYKKEVLKREFIEKVELIRSKIPDKKGETDWVSFRNSVALEYIKGTMHEVQINNFKGISEQIKTSVLAANAMTDKLIGARVFTDESEQDLLKLYFLDQKL